MLSILLSVLTVLKIIGIVLLVILGIILFLLLLVLFVPVLYRADVSVPQMEFGKPGEGFDVSKITAKSSFSWLGFVVRGGIGIPKNKEFTLRVFGIKVLPKKEKPPKEDKEKDKEEPGNASEPEKEEIQAVAQESAKEDSAVAENDQEQNSETASQEEISESTTDDLTTEGTQEEMPGDSDDDDDEPKSFLDVLWKIIDAIDNILKTPLNVFEKITCTISRVCDKIDMIKATLENEIFQRAYALVKKKLLRVLKMLAPDKCDIYLLLGTGDPASTAQLMALYGAMYPVLFKKVRFQPDFEKKVVESEIHIKGHATVFVVLWSAAVCFFNKDVKKTIRRFKKIINS